VRLYLSSFDLGNATDRLVSLAPQARVGLIVNALDNRPAARRQWRTRQGDALTALGFTVTELDLRDYFARPDTLRDVLGGLDMVWVNGGNTFILRRAMKISGFDGVIRGALADDTIAYAGFSAAAVVLPDSLEGLEAVDDPHDVPEGYSPAVEWSGLGVLPFRVVVHYQSDHAESAAVEREVAFYESRGLSYRMLRDGQALVIDGRPEDARIVG
jgi:dipeptidase E